MKKYSRHFIILICLTIIIARLIYPNLNFDALSLTLLGVMILIIIIPNPDKIFERAKKIKIGEFEIELEELSKETEKVEKTITEQGLKYAGLGGTKHPFEFEYEISNNLPTEILKISVEIEKTLRDIYEMAFKTREKRPLAVPVLIETLREKKVIDLEITKLLRQFWIFRNNIVHAVRYSVTEKEFLSFADIGIRVLKILKALQNNISDGMVRIEIFE